MLADDFANASHLEMSGDRARSADPIAYHAWECGTVERASEDSAVYEEKVFSINVKDQRRNAS